MSSLLDGRHSRMQVKGKAPKEPDDCSLVFGHAVNNRMTVRSV